MSATAMKDAAASGLADTPGQNVPEKSPKNYRGFVAGVFSGIAKLSGTSLDCRVLRSAADTGQWGTRSTPSRCGCRRPIIVISKGH